MSYLRLGNSWLTSPKKTSGVFGVDPSTSNRKPSPPHTGTFGNGGAKQCRPAKWESEEHTFDTQPIIETTTSIKNHYKITLQN